MRECLNYSTRMPHTTIQQYKGTDYDTLTSVDQTPEIMLSEEKPIAKGDILNDFIHKTFWK